MSDEREQKYCPCCEKNVLAVREGRNELVNLGCVVVLTVLTGGLLLPLLIFLWILWEISARSKPYLCPHCGSECLSHGEESPQAKGDFNDNTRN